MKKIVLLPKTDTITLCLPEAWIGAHVICKLIPMFEQKSNPDALELEVEKWVTHRNRKRKKKK